MLKNVSFTQIEDNDVKKAVSRLLTRLNSLKNTDATISIKARLEQRLLKAIMVESSIMPCAICGELFPIEFLVAAHIKKRTLCNEQERLDSNIVMPACKFGCDDLYEKGYVSVQDGFVIALHKEPVTPVIFQKVNKIIGNACSHYNAGTKIYFESHLAENDQTGLSESDES